MQGRPDAANLLTRLRSETRAEHDRIERTVGWDRWPPTSARYRGLLRRFLGYYGPIEDRLGLLPWAEHGFDWADRRKTSLLRHDLLSLGAMPPELDQIPRCVDLPRLDTLTEGFGCLYVLEGATLGGQVMTRSLQGSSLPTAFFAGAGADVGARWKSFRAFLMDYATGRDQDDAIIASARATFATFDSWLSGGEPE